MLAKVAMAMVVMGDTCVQSITAILLSGYYVGNNDLLPEAIYLLLSFIVAMAMAVMGDTCSKYHGHTHYYQATTLVMLLSFIVSYHGDGGDGRHVYTKYHSHTYYYQQLIGCYVGNGAL